MIGWPSKAKKLAPEKLCVGRTPRSVAVDFAFGVAVASLRSLF
jgi:hypothetical protein